MTISSALQMAATFLPRSASGAFAIAAESSQARCSHQWHFCPCSPCLPACSIVGLLARRERPRRSQHSSRVSCRQRPHGSVRLDAGTRSALSASQGSILPRRFTRRALRGSASRDRRVLKSEYAHRLARSSAATRRAAVADSMPGPSRKRSDRCHRRFETSAISTRTISVRLASFGLMITLVHLPLLGARSASSTTAVIGISCRDRYSPVSKAPK